MALFNRPAHGNATLCDDLLSFASSSVLNSILHDVMCDPSLLSSKSHLKRYLFRSLYKDQTFYIDHCKHVHFGRVIDLCGS